MQMSKARWYEVEGATAFIYDHPYPKHSQSVSIVPVAQLTYYRSNFTLRKCWK